MQKTILFYIVALLKFNILFAQVQECNINFFDVNNGLTSGNIRKIIQDNFGFIWVGTQDGLFRYDSNNFIAYNTLSPANHRLLGEDVRWLFLDSAHNTLWVATSYGGINAINLLTGNITKDIRQSDFSLLNNNLIKSFAVFNDYLLLGCERGLFSFQLSKNSLSVIPRAGGNNNDEYIDVVYKLNARKALILNRSREPFIVDAAPGNATTVGKYREDILLKDTAFRYLDCYMSANNTICITSTQSIGCYTIIADKLFKQADNAFATKAGIANMQIRRCIQDKKGKYWLASNKGLFTFDHDGFMQVQPNNKSSPVNSWLNAVFSIYADKDNNIWLGCQDGLAFVHNQPPPFISTSYSDVTKTKISHAYYLYPQNDSIIYSTAEEGLYKINRKTHYINQLVKSVAFDFIFSDPSGRLLTSNTNGLFILEGSRLIEIKRIYPEFVNAGGVRINSAIKINDSTLCFGTENDKGILVWNFKTHKIYNFNKSTTGITLAENTVNNLLLLSKNELLILSDASLTLFNYSARTIKRIDPVEYKTKRPLNIFFDACRIKDTFFIACYGHGVLKMDKQLKSFGIINSSNGLSNNGVYKVLPWKDSILFITTNNGLNAYEVETGRIKQYYKDDGLHDNAFEETSGNSMGHEIFAGGTNGFTTILPGSIKADSVAPVLYIDGLTVEKNGNIKKDSFNLFPKSFTIPNDAIQATIYFSAINFVNPGHTKLFYRIKELQNDWIDIGSQRFINLIGFPPGKYSLEVIASNTTGLQSKIRLVTIIFTPKWYQTILFKICLLLAGLLLLYGLYRYRIAQLKEHEMIRSGIASDLHDDLGGTINSMRIYLHMLETTTGEKQMINLLKESLLLATTGLRDMIWVLDDKQDTIADLMARIKQFAAPLTAAMGIGLTVNADSLLRLTLGKAEKRNLLLIAKESITNSIKYAGCKNVEVQLTKVNSKIALIVKDDGVGFNEVNVTPGEGLKNIRRRARQINFTVTIESFTQNGTTITAIKK